MAFLISLLATVKHEQIQLAAEKASQTMSTPNQKWKLTNDYIMIASHNRFLFMPKRNISLFTVIWPQTKLKLPPNPLENALILFILHYNNISKRPHVIFKSTVAWHDTAVN